MRQTKKFFVEKDFMFIFQNMNLLSRFLSALILLLALTARGQNIVPNSEPFEGDNFTKFVENLNYLSNLQAIELQGLTKGAAAQQPWSGSYWPTHKGLLANRYASSSYAKSSNFLDNYQSFQAHPATGLVSTGRVNELSPAEKYDLLIGDTNWSLTKFMWEKGFKALQANGVVAGWTGICHGWAAVTSMDPTSPYSAVAVRDVTGQHEITFYANDIKALLSFLWAESAPSSFRSGNRCRKSHGPSDIFLRPNDPPCLDTNPMTWHLAVVNRIGMNKMSMVMDASAGPEVWNYPIAGYDYNYFDPKTYMPTHSLKSAMRPIAQIPNDPFKNYRSPNAKFLVGVVMDVFHPALTQPSPANTNHIVMAKETFRYDLELDEGLNVIGGEWYGEETPDFIWSFSAGSRAATREDLQLLNDDIGWDTASPMSGAVATLARQASQRGEVLATITQALLNASKQQVAAPPPAEESVNVEEPIP